MKYEIFVEETVSEAFEVEAENEEEALEKVRKGYLDCEYVLEPGDLLSAKAILVKKDGTSKEIEIV